MPAGVHSAVKKKYFLWFHHEVQGGKALFSSFLLDFAKP
jgi:hypothetical protein